MDRAQPAGGLAGRLAVAEHDPGGDVKGPVQASPRVLAVVGVLSHAGRHQRVRDLQQQRPSPAGQQHRLAVDPPGDVAGSVQAVVPAGGRHSHHGSRRA